MSDPRDLLTLEEAKRALRISATDTSEDAELAGYITAASRVMDSKFGNTVALSVTDAVHDGTNSSGRAWRKVIVLERRPVLSFGSVVEHQDGQPLTLSQETATTRPDEAFTADRHPPDPSLFSGFLRRRQGGFDARWWHGRDNILVTYTAGRVQTTADVDARFKQACAIVLANLWRDREPGLEVQGEFDVPRQSFPGFAVPNAARQLLAEEWGQHEPGGIA